MATHFAALVGQSCSSVERIMFTPASMIVSPSEIVPIIDIGTVIVERKDGTGGKERLFVEVRVAVFLPFAFVVVFVAFAADIPVDSPAFA